MSGHSKWSTIKRKKSAQDAKRGKIFTKLIREITVAARMGGGDPSGNPRLRAAIASARAVNMPKENIERAIKKGTGELAGYSLEEAIYEGYGPGGVAILIEALTDNRNRTTAELRYILSKHGGNLGEAGCVAWMFDKKGLIVFDRNQVDEDEVMEIALEAGAEDVREEDDQLEVVTLQSDFEEVKKAFDEQNIKYELAEVTMIPQNTVKLDDKQAEQMLKLMDALEDSDDVQKVYANFDIDEKILESIG
ncbi:MAG TPA: YebC/PmpR family DNA-binding transcriptional regulator [Deltaproteobacteria bacterium]|nr:MAG: YebC/PmpR family DNA-binding transcriptional regulator [Deltaproteobacteria bacterium]HDM76071.1 YebC/PmpR family DNA-binding transcriptional regulator [Deltaproteobacteria bacterium]